MINKREKVNMRGIVIANTLHGFVLIALFIGVIIAGFNKEKILLISMLLMFLGGILNFIAQMANGGKMPVFGNRMTEGGYVLELFDAHKDGDENTKLPLLCDGIEITFWRISATISMGDIVACLGLLLFFCWIGQKIYYLMYKI